MSGKFTDDDLKGLSEEEINALKDEDSTDNEDILSDIAGDDDQDDDQDDDTDADKDDKGSDKQDADKDDKRAADADSKDDKSGDIPADDKKGDDQTVITDEVPDIDSLPPVNFVPKLTGEVLPEFQAAIDKITADKQAEIDALDEQYEEGKLTQAELRAKTREIEQAIRTETRKLEAESQNIDIASQLWRAEQVAFFKANPQFMEKNNPVMFDILNQQVKRVANDPANAHLSNYQMLYLAKSKVAKAVEALTGAKPATADNKQPDKAKDIPAKPKVDKRGAQTLANVPAADVQDVSGDKFAYIDKLSGLEQEKALAKLSEADREAYLNGAY